MVRTSRKNAAFPPAPRNMQPPPRFGTRAYSSSSRGIGRLTSHCILAPLVFVYFTLHATTSFTSYAAALLPQKTAQRDATRRQEEQSPAQVPSLLLLLLQQRHLSACPATTQHENLTRPVALLAGSGGRRAGTSPQGAVRCGFPKVEEMTATATLFARFINPIRHYSLRLCGSGKETAS